MFMLISTFGEGIRSQHLHGLGVFGVEMCYHARMLLPCGMRTQKEERMRSRKGEELAGELRRVLAEAWAALTLHKSILGRLFFPLLLRREIHILGCKRKRANEGQPGTGSLTQIPNKLHPE
jgi:hypothetical protein